MIKSKRLAYDGRGNAVAKSEEELSTAIAGNTFIQYLIDCCWCGGMVLGTALTPV